MGNASLVQPLVENTNHTNKHNQHFTQLFSYACVSISLVMLPKPDCCTWTVLMSPGRRSLCIIDKGLEITSSVIPSKRLKSHRHLFCLYCVAHNVVYWWMG